MNSVVVYTSTSCVTPKMLQHPRESLNSPRGRIGTRSESCRVKHYIAHYRSPCCCRCPHLSLIQSEKKRKVSYGGKKASAPVRKPHIICFTPEMKKKLLQWVCFSRISQLFLSSGRKPVMEQSSTWEGKGKTRSLRDMRRKKQANHISNLYLLLLAPNYRAVWDQVAEDSTCKVT